MGSKKEDFKITEDEVKKIGEALKDEKFRKLFLEYAEEIQNPENRKLYEQEIAQLEQERGMNVEFIHPKPGHVLKTSVDGDKKAFINICQNDKIGKPVAKREVSADGKTGVNWSIPHSHTPPREDIDKATKKCTIYDVVFHPDTYRMATSNVRFRGLVEDTAIEGIEKQFGVKVDRKNIKRPNLTYKGAPTATVLRSKANETAKPLDDDDPIKDMPYPYDSKTSEEKANEMAKAVKDKQMEQNRKASKTKHKETKVSHNKDATTPKYTIIHRSDMDIQQFSNVKDSRPTIRPKELVITIELPLLSSSKPVELDIFEGKLVLKSNEPAKYHLDLKLPYTVDDEQGSAKFDKSRRCLIVTLPVVPEALTELVPESNVSEEKDFQLEESNDSQQVEKALIEVISDVNNTTKDTQTQSAHLESSPAFISHAPKISYDIPPFEFSQDNETITFIFNVKKIDRNSVSKLFPLPNVCHLKFISRGSGGFPLHYSFLAKFSAKNCFVPEHCSFDVSESNAVLLLLKEKDSRAPWEDFQAGTSLDELKDYTFDTEWTLLDDLERIETECIADHQLDNRSLEVTEMTRKKLSIKIQNKRKEENGDGSTGDKPKTDNKADELEELEEECPLSADIEVVHEKLIPDLHGILKQRTISESSEDQCLSASSGSGSPESPRDEFFKKSVTFNDRIDSATFKSKAAVSSMSQALKSKRRRMRKKQEKRNRKNSGSSDGSSDEHRFSDDQGEHSDKGVESIEENVNEEEDEVNGGDVKIKEPIADVEEEDVTKSSTEENENSSKHEKLVQDIKDKLTTRNTEENCDSDDEIDNNTARDSLENKSGEDEKECADEKMTEQSENTIVRNEEENSITIPANMISKPSDLTNMIGEGDSIVKIRASDKASGDDSGVECGEGSGEKGDKSDVETVLSWGDAPQSQDHRSECAFEFTNAMIYDLDVD